MITATFDITSENLSLRLEGHAGYAEIGKDTVCASATILAYTVAQYVRTAEIHGELVSPPEIRLDRGDIFISCEPILEEWAEIFNVFHFAKTGCQLLANNYSQYVRLIES